MHHTVPPLILIIPTIIGFVGMMWAVRIIYREWRDS